jgi:hypothetical protein
VVALGSLFAGAGFLGTVVNGFPVIDDDPIANGFAPELEGLTPNRVSPRFVTGGFAGAAGSAFGLLGTTSSLIARCFEASGLRRPRNALILPSLRRHAFRRHVQT